MAERLTTDDRRLSALKFALMREYIESPGNDQFRKGLLQITDEFANYASTVQAPYTFGLSGTKWEILLTLVSDQEHEEPNISRYVSKTIQLCDDVGLKPKLPDRHWWGYEHAHEILRHEMGALHSELPVPSMIKSRNFVGMGFSMPEWFHEELHITIVRTLHTSKQDALREANETIDEWWAGGDAKLKESGFNTDTTRRFTEHVHWLYMHVAEQHTYEFIAEMLDKSRSTIIKAISPIANRLGLSMPGPGPRTQS